MDHLQKMFAENFTSSLENEKGIGFAARTHMQEWKGMDPHFLCEVFKSIFRFDEHLFKKACLYMYRNKKKILALLYDLKKPKDEGFKFDLKSKGSTAYEDWLLEVFLPAYEGLIYKSHPFTHKQLMDHYFKTNIPNYLLDPKVDFRTLNDKDKSTVRLINGLKLHYKKILYSSPIFLEARRLQIGPDAPRLTLKDCPDFPTRLTRVQMKLKAKREAQAHFLYD